MSSTKRGPHPLAVSFLLVLLLLSVVSLLGTVPKAYAANESFETWCKAVDGTWSHTRTCGLNTMSLTSKVQGNVEIPSGATLGIGPTGSLEIYGVTLTVDSGAKINIANQVGYGIIIDRGATIANSGAINIENIAFGIENKGIITNSGTINIATHTGVLVSADDPPGIGIINRYLADVTNYGTINVDNDGGTTGIENSGGSITNYGTITIKDSPKPFTSASSVGILNDEGSITNYDTIDVANLGLGTFGIENSPPAYIINAGTIDIWNPYHLGTGVDNEGTIINTCTGIITIISPGTYSGKPYKTETCLPVLNTKVCDKTTGTCATTGVLEGNLGDSFYDTAVLTWSWEPYAPVPTGTVTYHLYSGGTCASADEIKGTVDGNTWPYVVTVGSGGSVPNSAAVTPLKPGTYSFMAVYSGDSIFKGSSSACTSAALESFLVTSVYPVGVLAVLAPLGALVAFVMLSKRKTRTFTVDWLRNPLS